MSAKPSSEEVARLRRSTLQQYSREATGILVIAVIIFAVILIRYWHYISWSLR